MLLLVKLFCQTGGIITAAQMVGESDYKNPFRLPLKLLPEILRRRAGSLRALLCLPYQLQKVFLVKGFIIANLTAVYLQCKGNRVKMRISLKLFRQVHAAVPNNFVCHRLPPETVFSI